MKQLEQQKDREWRDSTLDRWRRFNYDKPFYAWLANVAIMAALAGFFFGISSKPVNYGFLQIALSSVLIYPALLLLQRCSDKELAASPVAPQQLKAIGIFSLTAVLTSIGSFLFAVLSKRFGAVLPAEIHLRFLMGFSFSGLLGMFMGYAGRKSAVGLFAYRLAVTWFFGLVVVIIFLLVSSALRGSL